MDWKKHLSVVVSGLVLSACGGGGGGGGDGSSPGPQNPSFTVSTSINTGGSISPESATVASGGTATFTISPANGYQISAASGCGGSRDGLSYTTGAITANCEISVSFSTVGGSGSDAQAPTAAIVFPGPVSRSSAKTLTVRGTANDAGAVKAVRVNGIAASLTRSSAAVSLGLSAVGASAPKPLGNGAGGTDTDGDTVEWEVEIPVPSDDDATIVVETEDNAGNIETVADTAELKRRAAPTTFELDNENRQLVGQLWQMPFESGWYNPIVKWGLDDDSYEVIPVPGDFPYCGLFVLDSASNQFICPSLSGDHLQITALDIGLGTQRVLAGFNLDLDPAEWLFANLTEMKLSADKASLFLMLVYFSAASYDENKTVIFRYDLASGGVTKLIDGYTQSGKKIAAMSFSLADSGILAINSRVAGDIGGDDHLLLIDYEGGDVTSVSDPFELVLAKNDISEGSNMAYAVGYDGIVKADIVSGEQQVLSLESEELLFNIAQVGDLAIDEAANRLLIADTGYGYIFSVDTETGERSEFAADGVGSGKRLMAPRSIELDEENNRAYVLDDGGNASEVLFGVDLDTGDRTILARFNLACNFFAVDLVLDKVGGRIFSIFENEVYEVALVDGTVTPLTGAGAGSCGGSYQFSGGSLDESGNRLLLTDTLTDSVLALDLASNVISGVFQSPDIVTPVDVELDTGSGLMYVLTQEVGELYSYNPQTDETLLVLDYCVENLGRNAMSTDIGSVHGLEFDPLNPWIWISGDYLMRFDLETATCSVMPWKYYGDSLVNNISILDVEATSDGKLFGTKFNNLIQIDFESGELVTMSR